MQARAIAAQSVTQWSVGIRPTWRISEVRAALQQHANGDFRQSAQLVDSFGEDDLLPGLFERRADAVLGSDFEFLAVDAPNRQQSQRLADRYEPLWWDMFPESELAELIKWYRSLGVAIAVLDWDTGSAVWTARLRVLHPQFLRYDQFNRQWIYSAQEGELVVTPGDGRWVLLTDGSRGWMRGWVRSMAINWIAKQLTIRDWNRYNERHGLPIVLARAPAIAEEPDQEAFWEDVKAIGNETVAQLPSHLDENGAKFDLELLEAKDSNWTSFEKMLDRCDRRFMIQILGSNLSTEIVTQGSLAATKAHRGVEVAKATADAQKLSTELRKQALHPIVAFNVVVTIDVIPWPKWDTEPPEDDKTQAEATSAFSLAMMQFSKAGYDVENLDELNDRYGVKLVKRATPVLPEAAPQTDNAPPADDAVAAQ